MPSRKSQAVWRGNLKDGNGKMTVGDGGCTLGFSFASRFEEAGETNPEELIGAAHAGCFSMALSHMLAEAGYEPQEVNTTASVELNAVEGGFEISSIELTTRARIAGIDDATFQSYAADAKANCPVSKALAGTNIVLSAELLQP